MPQLIDFIMKYWSDDHIFTKSIEMLRFQHYNADKNEYNFILANNLKSGEIDGIIGLIPLSHYDPELRCFNETWGGIWKVRDDVHNEEIGMIGMLLFDYLRQYKTHCSISMSPLANKLHAIMKYKMGVMNQHFIINPTMRTFNVAVVPDDYVQIIPASSRSISRLTPIRDLESVAYQSLKCSYHPVKSIVYLINRFLRHPLYKYSFYGAYNNDHDLLAIFVTRKIEINGSKVIRIVDVLGALENLGSLRKAFIDILEREKYEYVDFMNYGIPLDLLRELGFDLLDPFSNIIIPNYFEPFYKKNIVIDCAIKSPHNCVIFKADSDQDRPSVIG